MTSFADIFETDRYRDKGYVVCKIAMEQEVMGVCLDHDDDEEPCLPQPVYIPAGTIAVVCQFDEGSTVPRWYLPPVTPPGTIVGNTCLTFAEVYEKEGLDPLELLLPYTGRPEPEEEITNP